MDEAKADDALLERVFAAADAVTGLRLNEADVERLADILAMFELEVMTLQFANHSLARALSGDDAGETRH